MPLCDLHRGSHFPLAYDGVMNTTMIALFLAVCGVVGVWIGALWPRAKGSDDATAARSTGSRPH
jgi:hypothetical protein